jgi:hypothetical protein
VNQVRNYSRQMWAVRALEVAPRPGCTVTEFECEEHGRTHVFVRRAYRPDHAPSLLYIQGFSIGPRGGKKTVYDHHNF